MGDAVPDEARATATKVAEANKEDHAQTRAIKGKEDVDMGDRYENASESPYAPAIDRSERHYIDDLLARLEDVDDLPTETEKGTDAASLRRHRDALNEDLKSAMLEGNASAVIRLRTMLADLPARILAADCDEIKRGIDDATERLGQLDEEIAYVYEIRKDNNKILVARMLEVEAAQAEVMKQNLQIEILKMEQTSCHQARRDYRLKLEKIMEDAATA